MWDSTNLNCTLEDPLSLDSYFCALIKNSEKSENIYSILIAYMELTSFYDIQMWFYGLVQNITQHGTLKCIHQYLVNSNFNSSLNSYI